MAPSTAAELGALVLPRVALEVRKRVERSRREPGEKGERAEGEAGQRGGHGTHGREREFHKLQVNHC